MRTPPLLADFIHARDCKPFCEKLLTLPIGNMIRISRKSLEDWLKMERLGDEME